MTAGTVSSMRMVLAVAFLLCGCATIYLPNTPEAQECNRECMFLANQCLAAGNSGFVCLAQKRQCWRTCPGAYED